MKTWPTITGALCANSHPGSYTGQDAFNDMLPVIRMDDVCSTGQGKATPNLYRGGASSSLKNRDYKDFTDIVMEENSMENDMENKPEGKKYVLRRLTPMECLRLQGLPDWWCDGVNGSDSAIYKMAGNGLAIPCACDILGRIAKEIENHG